MDPRLEQSAVTTIRTLAIDTVQAANSGHPGAPMGCAPMAHVVWTRHLRHAPSTPTWFDRDRFVLSNGHASALLYALLHLAGYDHETGGAPARRMRRKELALYRHVLAGQRGTGPA